MDLTTIKNKLNTHRYASLQEFCDDVDLVFSNCHSYWSGKRGGDRFTDAATNLRKFWDQTRVKFNIFEDRCWPPIFETLQLEVLPETNLLTKLHRLRNYLLRVRRVAACSYSHQYIFFFSAGFHHDLNTFQETKDAFIFVTGLCVARDLMGMFSYQLLDFFRTWGWKKCLFLWSDCNLAFRDSLCKLLQTVSAKRLCHLRRLSGIFDDFQSFFGYNLCPPPKLSWTLQRGILRQHQAQWMFEWYLLDGAPM